MGLGVRWGQLAHLLAGLDLDGSELFAPIGEGCPGSTVPLQRRHDARLLRPPLAEDEDRTRAAVDEVLGGIARAAAAPARPNVAQ
jgi:hypothetical protein